MLALQKVAKPEKELKTARGHYMSTGDTRLLTDEKAVLAKIYLAPVIFCFFCTEVRLIPEIFNEL
jgi:hypothetical protein